MKRGYYKTFKKPRKSIKLKTAERLIKILFNRDDSEIKNYNGDFKKSFIIEIDNVMFKFYNHLDIIDYSHLKRYLFNKIVERS